MAGRQEKQEKGKKSILLRLDSGMWDEIAALAEAEFRSVNGQIEYLLHESLKQRKKNRKDGA